MGIEESSCQSDQWHLLLEVGLLYDGYLYYSYN